MGRGVEGVERKKGREREGRGEAGHEHMGGEWGKKGKRVRERESEEGAAAPFYGESGTPGYCQATVGRSLDEMSTVEMHHGNVAQLIRVHP